MTFKVSGRNMNAKIVSKFQRILLTEDIRKLVYGIPNATLRETQVGNHVYMADGEIGFGIRKRPLRVRISREEDGLRLYVRAGGEVDIGLPYGTKDERDGALAEVWKEMRVLVS